MESGLQVNITIPSKSTMSFTEFIMIQISARTELPCEKAKGHNLNKLYNTSG